MKNIKKLFISSATILSIVLSGVAINNLTNGKVSNNEMVSLLESETSTKSNGEVIAVPGDGESYFNQDYSLFGYNTSTTAGMIYRISKNDYNKLFNEEGKILDLSFKVNGGIFESVQEENPKWDGTIFEIRDGKVVYTEGFEGMFEWYSKNVTVKDEYVETYFKWKYLSPGEKATTNISIVILTDDIGLSEEEKLIVDNVEMSADAEEGKYEFVENEETNLPNFVFDTGISSNDEEYDLDFKFRIKYGSDEIKYFDQKYGWSTFDSDNFVPFEINDASSEITYEENGITSTKSFSDLFGNEEITKVIPGENDWDEVYEYTYSTQIPPNKFIDVNEVKFSVSGYDDFVFGNKTDGNLAQIESGLLPYNFDEVESSLVEGSQTEESLSLKVNGIKDQRYDDIYEEISTLKLKLTDAENAYGSTEEIPADSELVTGKYDIDNESYLFEIGGLTANTIYNSAELYVNDKEEPIKTISLSNVQTLPNPMDFSDIEDKNIEYVDDTNSIIINIYHSELKENLSPTKLTVVDGNNYNRSMLRVPDTIVMTTRLDETMSFDSNFDPFEGVTADATYDKISGDLIINLDGLREGVYYNVESVTIYDDGPTDGVTKNTLALNHEFHSDLNPYNVSGVTVDDFAMDHGDYLNSKLSLTLNVPEASDNEAEFNGNKLTAIVDNEGNRYTVNNFNKTSNTFDIVVPSEKIGEAISFTGLAYDGEEYAINTFTCDTVKLFDINSEITNVTVESNVDDIEDENDDLTLTFSSETNSNYYSSTEEPFTTATINGNEYQLERVQTKSVNLTYKVVGFKVENGQSIEVTMINGVNLPADNLAGGDKTIEIKNFPWWIVGGSIVVFFVLLIVVVILTIVIVKWRRNRFIEEME